MTDRFRFRWGIPEWDAGYTIVPNPVLERYSTVPWVDKDGNQGIGISNQEMMFILHLSSFRYEASWSQPPNPSLSTTLRQRMGYANRRSVINLKESLIHKNLLEIHEMPGKTHEYNFSRFAYAIYGMEYPLPVYPNTHLPVYPNTHK